MTRRVGAFVSALVLSGWACAGLGVDLESHDRSERRKKKTDDGEVEVIRYFAEANCELKYRQALDALEARRRDAKALKKPG